MPIRLLPPQLANQIAAGEVVERPASVVKELVENSLDAGATEIDIVIERGGHKRICIRDNGCGIAKDELTLALSRHATSKIVTLEDLESIMSLGFRGEALASISAVSRLTLTSKPPAQKQAWQAYCQGRDMQVEIKPAAHPDGTSIDVGDLFYNTPARRKFLKAERTEFMHIEEVVKRLALSHPHIGFRLIHNDKLVKRLSPVPRAQEMSRRVADVMGNAFLQNSVYVSMEYEGIKAKGWLGNQHQLRSANDQQFVFINQRAMRDKLTVHAIRTAYETSLAVVEQPSFLLLLEIDPRELDVNVHPAKHEVRFQQPRLVHDFIQHLVSHALRADTTQEDFSVITASMQEKPIHGYKVPQQLSTRQRATARSSADSVTPAYQSAWRSLNTVTEENEQRFTTVSQSPLNAIYLSKRHRLWLDEPLMMMDALSFIAMWAADKLYSARLSQPLFVPVVVEGKLINKTTLDVMTSMHFRFLLAGNKYRVTDVPEGCRYFPWLHWLPIMLRREIQCQDDVIAVLVELEWQGSPPDWEVLWQWFEKQSNDKKNEIKQMYGVMRTQQQLIEWWSK